MGGEGQAPKDYMKPFEKYGGTIIKHFPTPTVMRPEVQARTSALGCTSLLMATIDIQYLVYP